MENRVTDQNAPTGPRKYMSKGRRACDLCRSRKSACQIEVAPPCRMCRAHGQKCEFTNRVVRRKRQQPSPRPEAHAEAHPESGNAPVWQSHHQEESSARHPDTEMSWPQGLEFLSMPEGSLASASDHHMFGATDGQLTSSFLAGGPENTDQFTIDDLMLSIYEGKTTLSDVYQEAETRSDPSSLDHASLTPQVCGLTGDMDPYVLRYYQFDEKSEFAFSKLTIRKVEDGQVPVQFLLSKPELNADSRSKTNLRNVSQGGEMPELAVIVPPEVAERLIEL